MRDARYANGVRARIDGSGDRWALFHRYRLPAAYHMDDIDGYIRTYVDGEPYVVCLFDHKQSYAAVDQRMNAKTTAGYLACARLLQSQQPDHFGPKFVLWVSTACGSDLIEHDLHTGDKLKPRSLNSRELPEVRAIVQAMMKLEHQDVRAINCENCLFFEKIFDGPKREQEHKTVRDILFPAVFYRTARCAPGGPVNDHLSMCRRLRTGQRILTGNPDLPGPLYFQIVDAEPNCWRMTEFDLDTAAALKTYELSTVDKSWIPVWEQAGITECRRQLETAMRKLNRQRYRRAA